MNKKRTIILLVILLIFFAAYIYRPDVRLAVRFVTNVDEINRDSNKVSIASQYLIKTKHPISYSLLGQIFNSCHIKAHQGGVDWPARTSAEILGKYKTQEAFDTMVGILSRDYSGEAPPCSVNEIPYGLSLLGDTFFFQLEMIAQAPDVYGFASVNAITAIGLMSPPHPNAISALEQLLNTTQNRPAAQGRILHALSCIKTPAANNIIQDYTDASISPIQIPDIYPCLTE